MKENNSFNLVEDIDKFSGSQLKRKGDLLTLINLGYSNNQKELIEELSFTSKYVQGLFRVLKQSSSGPDVQNIELIKNDVSNNLSKVKEKIGQLISNSDEITKKHINETYLQLSQNNLFNLTELMNDFEWTKKYLNHLKRENRN